MVGYFSLWRSKSQCFVGPAAVMHFFTLWPTTLFWSSGFMGSAQKITYKEHLFTEACLWEDFTECLTTGFKCHLVQTSNLPYDSGLGFVDMDNTPVYTVHCPEYTVHCPEYTLLSADMRDKQFTILKSKQFFWES